MLAKIDEGYDLVHGGARSPKPLPLAPPAVAHRQTADFQNNPLPIHDLGCTAQSMRRDIASDLRLYGEMHRFIPIFAHWHGAKCVEMSLRIHPRLRQI